MRIHLPLALLAVAAGAASAASAQETTNPAFTGLRVEGLGGWDRTQADGGHKDGVLYGIGAGYDIATHGLLVGVEGEANDSTSKTCSGDATALSNRLCAKAGRDLYVGARVGTIVGGRTLLYAKAGYTNGRYKLTSDDGTGSDTLAHKDLDGVRLGAGAEYAITPNTFVKAEYRYSNYEQGISRNQVVGGFGIRF